MGLESYEFRCVFNIRWDLVHCRKCLIRLLFVVNTIYHIKSGGGLGLQLSTIDSLSLSLVKRANMLVVGTVAVADG